MKTENLSQEENPTQAYVDATIKYSLFRTAGEEDNRDKRSATVTPEEKKTIDHIISALSIVEDKDSSAIHASFEAFRNRDPQLEKYENALPPAPSVLSPRYDDAVAFLQEIGIEEIRNAIKEKKYDTKYTGIISAALDLFNITTQTQTRLALGAALGKEKERLLVGTCGQSPALDKTDEGVRILAKNLISICFENDGAIDRKERKKINAALKRIGYTNEEIDHLTLETTTENAHVAAAARDISHLGKDDYDEEHDVAVKNNIAKYVECVRYGLKHLEENNEFHALFRKAAQYFGIRKKDAYDNILLQVKKELAAEKEQGKEERDAKKKRVLVLDGNSISSRNFASMLQTHLKDSEYSVELRDAEKAYADLSKGLGDLVENLPEVTIVDPLSDKGTEILQQLRGRPGKVYAFAPDRESKKRIREMRLEIPVYSASLGDIAKLIYDIKRAAGPGR